jgi:non-heme chloroperoxidase
MEHYQKVKSQDGTHLFSRANHPRTDGVCLLFVPGVGVSSDWWQRQFNARELNSFFQVSFDLRGHGASDKPKSPEAYQSSQRWAEDVEAVCNAWSLTNPVLVGWSYGAHVVLDYLSYFGQERVRGVVLVDANYELGTDFAQQAVAPGAMDLFTKIDSPEAATFRDGLQYGLELVSNKIAPEHETAFLGAMAFVRPDVWQAMFYRRTDHTALLKNLKLPLLIVHGRSDKIFSLQSSERLASLVPKSKLVIFDTGHAPHYDEADAFNRMLGEWLATLA